MVDTVLAFQMFMLGTDPGYCLCSGIIIGTDSGYRLR